jgi:hypothetical protein
MSYVFSDQRCARRLSSITGSINPEKPICFTLTALTAVDRERRGQRAIRAELPAREAFDGIADGCITERRGCWIHAGEGQPLEAAIALPTSSPTLA